MGLLRTPGRISWGVCIVAKDSLTLREYTGGHFQVLMIPNASIKGCHPSLPLSHLPLLSTMPLPASLSSAMGDTIRLFHTHHSPNRCLFQQQSLMETNSVQGSIMGLFSYLWTEYFPLKDANDSLRDKLIKTQATDCWETEEASVLKCYPHPTLCRKLASCPYFPTSISPQMNTFKTSWQKSVS